MTTESLKREKHLSEERKNRKEGKCVNSLDILEISPD